ncbi:hypothetical protein JCM10908_006175 [Rhodotorula pacifica]|uniref:uncharacterized protein n=1 Tax=Rhodotorula pacifica TaxID=1495444 RepID=UPI0031737B02
MARDRLAAIRGRGAQGCNDPPSVLLPPRAPNPAALSYSWTPAPSSPRPPDSPRDFNPFAIEQPQPPSSPYPDPSRRLSSRRSSSFKVAPPPAATAPTGWFSGFSWGWIWASAPSPRQPSIDYGRRSLPSEPSVRDERPVLGDDSPRVVGADYAARPYSPEADIPRDFNPNDVMAPSIYRPSIAETLESPRSSVVLSPDLDVRDHLPSSSLPAVHEESRPRKRKTSMLHIASRKPSEETIYEGVGADEEKDKSRETWRVEAASRHPATSQQVGRDGRARIQKGDVPHETMSEFFEEITTLQQDLRRARSLIQIIVSLRDRLLAIPSAESAFAIETRDDLSAQTAAARELFTSVHIRLRVLEQGNANLRVLIPAGQSLHNLSLRDVDVRDQQVGLLKGKFKEVIHQYVKAEREHRVKQRARLERQIKVVNPSLPPEEVQDLVKRAEDGESSAIFAQATTGYRSHAARGALHEVQNRAVELARIEQTLIELAQLFQDMAVMVEAQDVVIVDIEQTAANVSHDMEKGVEQVQVAVKHARNARKMRWICFGIMVIILVIVAVVLFTTLIPPALRARNNNNNSNNVAPASSAAPATPTA